MLAATLAQASQDKTPVAESSKYLAIAIGIGVLLLLYVVIALISGHWRLKELVNGFDGFASTSKLQWFLWLIVILFGYAAIWSERALQGNYQALSDIPVSLLTVLGFSTGTAAAAKGITSGFVQAGKMTKPGAPAGEPGKNTGGIFQDDGGAPELAKIQMIGFTIVAVGIFVATVVHQIFSAKTNANLTAALPDIDASLLVLMGISQGGYLGKKLVTFGTPALYPLSPDSGIPGTTVTLRGANLGSPPNSQLMLNGVVLNATWSPTSVQFTVPVNDPATGAAWAGLPTVVPVVVSAGGQPSNSVNFTVAAPVLSSLSPVRGLPGTSVTVAGTYLGSQPGSQLTLDGRPINATNWSDTSFQFVVPVNDPATGAAWTGLPRLASVSVSLASQVSNQANFTIARPALSPPSPGVTLTGKPGDPISLTGTDLGPSPGGQLLLAGMPIATTGWTATQINFTVPDQNPAGNVAWATPEQTVQLVVSVAGQASDPIDFKVTAAAP